MIDDNIQNCFSQDNIFQINMLLSLIKDLKTFTYHNKNNEIYIYFYQNNETTINKNLKLMNHKYTSNNIISICLGGEYEYTKLKINNESISVYLTNENGEFILNNIPYNNIIGYLYNKKLIKYSHISNANITLKDLNTSYLNKFNTDKEKYSYIFNYFIEKILSNVIKNGLINHQVIKITFIDNENNITTNNNEKYKLLTIIIDDEDWKINIKDEMIYLSINNKDENENLAFHISKVMTIIDTYHLIYFNRYLKFSNEDFQDMDLSIYTQDNLFFVDFNHLLEEEITSNITDFFKNDNNTFINELINNNKNSIENEDNLIIGNFDVKDKTK